MSEVIHLIDRAGGYPPEDPAGLFAWAESWLDGLKRGEYGDIRSLVFVIESTGGQLATLSQSLGAMDTTRLIGLLTIAAHRKADGAAKIEDLRQ